MFTEFHTLDDKLQEQLNSRDFPDSSLFFDIERRPGARSTAVPTSIFWE